MSSPIPPDPYAALGVAKDADISAVRTAHRKLVLKHHPDRISDPALKERGQHLFTEIQQAYELLSDPVRRSRYDDKIKLAELRKEAMMRDSPRSQAYPMRPAPHSASNSREWNTDDQVHYETRRPRESEFDSKDRFDLPNRTTSRKHSDYERSSTAKKPDRSAKAAWGVAAEAVKFGIRVKKDAEKKTAAKSHQSKQEMRDREKRQARTEKSRQAHVVDAADSDSDNATFVSHVTASTIRPSKSVPRHESSSARSSGAYQRRAYTDDDSDTATYVSMKWEERHFDSAKEYMAKASGGRPSISREDSFWGQQKAAGHQRHASDSERRPISSRGRRGSSYDEPPIRPSMPTQNSAPGGLKNRVEERAPGKERRAATGIYPDHRKEMPSFSRSQTMPVPRPTAKNETAPSKSSNLKHAENQDSGYGSSSASHTPEMREESPPRRPKMANVKSSSTKYQIVDPTDSDDDRRTQIRVVDDEGDRRRHQRSPERGYKDSDRKREKGGPRMETRSKTMRDSPSQRPKPARMESSKHPVESRSPRDVSRDTPPVSRHNSGRERERLYGELSDDEKPYRYKYPSGEKINMRPSHPDPQYVRYRDSPDRRSGDYFSGSHPSSRRPSVQAQG